MLSVYRLFNPEKMLALAICITPVNTANFSDLLLFNASERKVE